MRTTDFDLSKEYANQSDLLARTQEELAKVRRQSEIYRVERDVYQRVLAGYCDVFLRGTLQRYEGYPDDHPLAINPETGACVTIGDIRYVLGVQE